MKFNHDDKGLVIKFSWKERFNLFLKGHLAFDKKNSSHFYTHLLHMISTGLAKYGDSNVHGQIDENTKVDTK